MAETENAENSQEAENPVPTIATEEKTSSTTDTTDIGQKLVDITLGAAVITGEFTIQAAKYLAEHGPELLDTLESKGRPVREQIDEWLKNSFTQSFKDAASTDKEATPSDSAEDEISALERRVRELESQVGQTPAPSNTPVAPDLEDTPITPSTTSTPPSEEEGKPEASS